MANSQRAAVPLINTAAGWTADNPTLPSNVHAIESDTGRAKYGDGVTPWATLGYSNGVVGTSPVATVAIQEYGNGKQIVSVLTLTNFIVGAIPAANAALGVGNIVFAFPAGQHFELAYALSGLALTLPGTAKACDTGLGSVIASGAVSVLDGTTTFEDRLTGVTVNTAAGGGAAVSSIAVPTAGIGTDIGLNLAASVKNVFLNASGTFVTGNAGNLLANGTIVLSWIRMQ